MHVTLLCVTYSLRLVMARGLLYLVVNTDEKTLSAPEQSIALQFCSHILLYKPKAHSEDCGIP